MPDLHLFFVQLAIVLLAARSAGAVFRRLGQPQVVGEMVAGIALGPSLFGWLAPGTAAALFPADSLGYVGALSQLGLLFFMFLVGLEIDPRALRERGRSAVAISYTSIAVPFALGALLAVPLFERVGAPGGNAVHFALFMGAAMSITAFPVLARILAERDLLRTPLGALAVTCAAVDDVTAWTLLASIIVLVRADAHAMPLPLTIGGTLIFAFLMLRVVRPRLAWIGTHVERTGRMSQNVLATVLLVALLSAAATEWLGIHALFGAFLAGAVLPREPRFVEALVDRLRDVTVVILLPLFFAITGLRTSLGLAVGADMIGWTVLVLAVAIAGKFGGSYAAARWTGMQPRDAAAIGALMNTRGLMELVILNIGLELGVLGPTAFGMMVIMAITTTLMTPPLLDRIMGRRSDPGDRSGSSGQQ